MKKLRNKILSAVLVLSLLLTSSSFAFAVGDGSTESTGVKYTLINDQLTVTGVSSYDNQGPASNAVDKTNGSPNTGTFWHTFWDTSHPHDGFTTAQNNHNGYIIVDLKHARYFSQLGFLPRTNGSNDNYQNGRIEKYEVYVSSTYSDVNSKDQLDGTWTMATKGDWNWTGVGKNNVAYRYATLDTPIYTRYVKLQARETYDGHVCASNLNFYEDTTGNANVPTITIQPQSAEYVNASKIQELSVTANNANSYQWYKTEDGTLDSGVVIPNAIASTYQPTDFGNYFVKVTSSDGSYVFSNIAEIKSFEAKVNNDYYVSFKDAVSRATNGSTIEVLKDIELSSPITIDKEITIKSVDNLIRTTQLFTIKRTTGNNGVMFTVATNGNLTLDNIIIDGGAVWEDGNTAATATSNSGIKGGALVKVVNNGTLTVKAGATLQNNENISSAGGAISADADGSNYSNIHVYGKILNNKVIESRWNNGGGIASDGDLYIYEGAVISGNFAPQSNEGGEGGGIQIFQAGSLYLYGGTIKDNRAGQCNNISFGNSDSARKRPVQLMGNVEIESINLKNKNDADTNKTIEVVGELNGSINVILGNGVDGDTIATINENVSKENILNVFKVNDKITYLSGNEVKFGTEANYSTNLASEKSIIANPDGSASTTLTVEATGTEVTYKWYKCSTKDGGYEEIPSANEKTLTLNSLEKGSTYYYCVIDNGDESKAGPKTSTTCEVKVTDFYPCSKAIEKFKSI